LDSASGTPAPWRLGRLWRRLAPDPSFAGVIAVASYSKSGAKEEVGPADVFAAGFDADDSALVALLERAGLSRAAVLRWVSGDPAAAEAPSPSEVPRAQGGFLARLRGRLTWRVLPADDASSSDAVIAACGIVALAVWLAYDRYAAGTTALWYPGGMAGLAWYVAGVFALAYVLHRVSRALGGFRNVLAAIVGCLPLAVAVVVALRWAPLQVQRGGVLLLAGAGLAHARAVLASVGARRPRAAILAAVAFVAVFAWGTQRAWVRPRLWYPHVRDDEPGWADSERLLFEQADRIDAAAARVRPGDPDRPSVFFVGFAGTGEQKVFAEEVKLAGRVISERYERPDALSCSSTTGAMARPGPSPPSSGSSAPSAASRNAWISRRTCSSSFFRHTARRPRSPCRTRPGHSSNSAPPRCARRSTRRASGGG
jgi:hypothetical protein